MITAIIRNKENTLVLELPHSIYDIYEKLQSIGIMQPPKRIPLTDNEDEDIGVKLFSESDFGQHLLLTLHEKNTIADANMLTLVIGAASEDIKEELEQNILYDQYDSMDEVINAVRQMTQDAGPVKAVFFCPLVGNIDEGDGDMFTVGDSYLADSADEIADALNRYTANDENDMATYYNKDDGVNEKLTSAVWSVELHGDRLFGRIDCSLKEALTAEETEALRDWLTGQCSDGLCEGFEQQPIDTMDGELFVSFWNSGDDYAKAADPIPFGTYTVKETVFPKDYRAYGKSEWTVTLNKNTPNATITIKAVNELIPGSAKIVKVSEDGKVDGITFRIQGNGIDKTVKTANGGVIQVDNLKPGVYTVTESEYDKYIPQEVRRVTVVSGQVSTVNFSNKLRRGDLTVKKTAEDGLTEGMKFRLYGTSISGIEVNEYAVTDKNGIAKFKNVLIGTGYTLEEVDTPTRYVVPDKQTAAVEWNKVTNKSFDNVLKKFNVTVTKSDSEKGLPHLLQVIAPEYKAAIFGKAGGR